MIGMTTIALPSGQALPARTERVRQSVASEPTAPDKQRVANDDDEARRDAAIWIGLASMA